MPQSATIDLSAGFVPRASQPDNSGIDLSAGLVQKQETPPTRQATAPEQQITGQFQNAPMQEATTPLSLLSDIGRSIRKNTVDVWNASKQKDIELGGQGNAVMGFPDMMLDSLREGERQAQQRSRAAGPFGVLSNFPENVPGVGPIVHSIADTARAGHPLEGLTDIALLKAVPEVSEKLLTMPSPPEVLGNAVRRTTRNLVGASPSELEEAAGKVGEQTQSVAEKNATATEAAKQKNAQADAEAQRQYNESLQEHEGSSGQAEQDYQTALQEHQAETEAGHQKVTEQRAAEETKQQQRQKLLDESDTHATNAGTRLDETLRTREKQVKALYHDAEQNIDGEADAADIAERMQGAASAAMKEHGPIPSIIQRIISRFTPAEEAAGEGEGGVNLGDASADMLDAMVEQGIFLPEEEKALTGESATAARPTFENLHSQYSALGKLAAQTADRFQRAAYLSAQEVLRQSMKELSDAAGGNATELFNKAQGAYSQMARTFYNRSSPVARAIAKYREVVGALKDNPKAPSIAGHFVRDELTRGGKFNYGREMLSQFEGAPVDNLDAMKTAHDQAKQLPPKAKVIPDYTPKPAPQRGAPGPAPVLERPVPAHTADLTPPPEPFNPTQFIKGKMTEKGRQMVHLSPYEIGGPAAGLAGGAATAMLGEPLVGAGIAATSLGYPIGRYGMGRLFEHPGFQDWVSQEPPAGFTPGSKTPFQAPPPGSQPGPVSPSTGPGPSTPPAPPPPPPPPGPSFRPPGSMGSMDIQIMRNGKPTTVTYSGMTTLDGVAMHHVIENGKHVMIPADEFKLVPGSAVDAGETGRSANKPPPPPVSDFRESVRNLNPFADRRTDTAGRVEVTNRAEYLQDPSPSALRAYLKHLGMDVDPTLLKGELHRELTDVFDELGQRPLKPSDLRAMKAALDMKNVTGYQIADRIRSKLFGGK